MKGDLVEMMSGTKKSINDYDESTNDNNERVRKHTTKDRNNASKRVKTSNNEQSTAVSDIEAVSKSSRVSDFEFPLPKIKKRWCQCYAKRLLLQNDLTSPDSCNKRLDRKIRAIFNKRRSSESKNHLRQVTLNKKFGIEQSLDAKSFPKVDQYDENSEEDLERYIETILLSV